jgi:methionine sulfoxide reductase heme-binding subunit
MRTILNNKFFIWLVLAVPAVPLLAGWWQGRIDTMDMLHPTGEWSARLMIFAMMLSPLVSVIGPRRWLNWLVARRRAIGVASFCYAMLHLVFYLIDMGNMDDILAEWLAPGIWTGWAALLVMIPIAATSNDASMRALKSGWKRIQRLVYPAALLTLLHWIWVHNSITGAAVHFAPIILLIVARVLKSYLPLKPKNGV